MRAQSPCNAHCSVLPRNTTYRFLPLVVRCRQMRTPPLMCPLHAGAALFAVLHRLRRRRCRWLRRTSPSATAWTLGPSPSATAWCARWSCTTRVRGVGAEWRGAACRPDCLPSGLRCCMRGGGGGRKGGGKWGHGQEGGGEGGCEGGGVAPPSLEGWGPGARGQRQGGGATDAGHPLLCIPTQGTPWMATIPNNPGHSAARPRSCSIKLPILPRCPPPAPAPYTPRPYTRTLRPAGRQTAQLVAEELDSRQVFGCVNAMRPLAPGGTFRLLVGFTPQARTQSLEMLTVRCANQPAFSNMRAALEVGVWISPCARLLGATWGSRERVAGAWQVLLQALSCALSPDCPLSLCCTPQDPLTPVGPALT